jgi:5'-nucleotidase
MDRSSALFALALTLAACPAAPRKPGKPPTGTTPKIVTLQLLTTNDLHGQLEPVVLKTRETPSRTISVGGAEALAATIADLRRGHPLGTLLIDAGDMLHGTLLSNTFEGRPMAELMTRLRYDAAVLGNHEFDFGPVGPASTGGDRRGALKAWLRVAGFPVLSANIENQRGTSPAWPNLRSWIIVERQGIRIGLIGLITPSTRTTTLPANVEDLRFTPMLAAAVRAARTARSQGADVVVLVAHAGGTCASSAPESCRGEVFDELVRRMPRALVDVVVAAHSHSCFRHEVNGIPVVQACSRGVAVGRVLLQVDRRTRRVVDRRVALPAVACHQVFSDTRGCEGHRRTGTPRGAIMANPLLQRHRHEVQAARAVVRRYQTKLGPRGDEVLAAAARPLLHRWDGNGEVGTLVANALLAAIPTADLAVINAAALRANLPAGPIRYSQLYAAFPFDNKLATVRLSGAAMQRMFSALLRRSHGVPHLAGGQLSLRCSKTNRDELISVSDRRGHPIVADRRYTVVLNDYLLSGGGGLKQFLMSVPAADRQVFSTRSVRDEIAKHLRSFGSKINPIEHPIVDPAHPPVQYHAGPCRRPDTHLSYVCR